jgi:hypothetical protein
MPPVWSYLLAVLGTILLAGYLMADGVILIRFFLGGPVTAPEVRVRWYGIDAWGWAALVPPHLFALLLILANRDAATDLLRAASFRLRYLWLWMTGR